MDPNFVRRKLTEVLESIQLTSGLECPTIVGATKPLEALPKFDSKIWPVAIGMLAAELGITIADNVNIFRREKSCIALTVDETVAMVVALVETQVHLNAKQVNAQ